MTATDLAHGPLAVLDPLFPVWTIASHDQTLPAVREVAARVREFVTVPEPAVPLLSPLLSVVAAQLFASALARTKSFGPDSPRGLTKGTLARCASNPSSNLVPHAAVVAPLRSTSPSDPRE